MSRPVSLGQQAAAAQTRRRDVVGKEDHDLTLQPDQVCCLGHCPPAGRPTALLERAVLATAAPFLDPPERTTANGSLGTRFMDRGVRVCTPSVL